MLKKVSLLTAGFVLSVGALTAQAASDPIEAAQEYRHSAFEMIKYHFGPMGAMVKGDMPFDAEAFKKNAGAVATLSQFPINGFIPGSYEGDTEAKPEIESNMDDFKAKMETFVVESGNLAKAAESGNMDDIKPVFGKVAQSCKACHESYRKED